MLIRQLELFPCAATHLALHCIRKYRADLAVGVATGICPTRDNSIINSSYLKLISSVIVYIVSDIHCKDYFYGQITSKTFFFLLTSRLRSPDLFL